MCGGEENVTPGRGCSGQIEMHLHHIPSPGTKGTFHAKMGSIKDINGMDLTEAEDIKKRWQEYTEELSKTSS